jgi:predicted Rossmann fold nucleotide-binding protein DprA/Smf involved in DNA uptake
VPGHVTSHVARGTNGLLRDGAVPVTRAEDVLDELFGVGVRQVPRPALVPERAPPGADLLRILQAAERHRSVAGICAELRADPAEVRAALGRLEADGHLVRRDLGGWERVLLE